MAEKDPVSQKPLIDKLVVKPDMRVAVIAVDDPDFLQALAARTAAVEPVPSPGVEMVFLGVEEPDHMLQLPALKETIARDGAIWVVYRKGRKDFNENDVLRLGLESGMVDNKVVRFSDTHSATRFVIRKHER